MTIEWNNQEQYHLQYRYVNFFLKKNFNTVTNHLDEFYIKILSNIN